jgi:hypothetical protein
MSWTFRRDPGHCYRQREALADWPPGHAKLKRGAIRLNLGNSCCAWVGGRHSHPQALIMQTDPTIDPVADPANQPLDEPGEQPRPLPGTPPETDPLAPGAAPEDEK